MSRTLAAILGGAAGAMTLLGILIIIIWYCAFRAGSFTRRSETGSSDPSQVGRGLGTESAVRQAKRYEMEELLSATRNFDEKSLIGTGKFGEVYKGMLNDGMLVAIKKRHGPPNMDFVDEVRYLSTLQHRNLVTLLGYCQENDVLILVYEYIPNGSVSIHLYGSGPVAQEKLEFKHRLAIALGAAKGLNHLHSLNPSLIHKNFKSANVLVDENLIPKVADAGIHNLIEKINSGEKFSQQAADDIFLAPEVREMKVFSDRSDVYSFGVFLLELINGYEAEKAVPSEYGLNVAEWMQEMKEEMDSSGNMSTIIRVDERLGNSYTRDGMRELIEVMVHCLKNSSESRPEMSDVIREVDRILEKEMSLTTIMGEGTPVVTLGSQLFRPVSRNE